MNLVKVKHSMDEEFKVMTLDEAFLEALSLSSGRSCAIERFESDLLNSINSFIDKGYEEYILDIIKDEYKMSILKRWEYEIEELAPNNLYSFDSDKDSFKYPVSDLVSVDRGKYNTKYQYQVGELVSVDVGKYNATFTCEVMQTEE